MHYGTSQDHAVLMVAAGTDDDLKVDYYTIKNSWGAKWGEHGYVRIARGAPKQAGIGGGVLSAADSVASRHILP